MPDVYPPGEFDLAGFVVGVMDRATIGANGAPAAGDVLLGLPLDRLAHQRLQPRATRAAAGNVG